MQHENSRGDIYENGELIPLSKFDWLIKKQEKTMMKEAFNTLVRKYVGDGKTDNAFTSLLEWAQENGDAKTKNAILALRNQWKDNETESRMGTSSYDEINRTRAKIVRAILEIADTLEGINEPPQKQDCVTSQTKKTILFITSSPNNLSVPNVGRQQSVIKEAMKDKRKEDFYEIKTIGFVQPEDLIDEIEEAKPDIIHFFMHNNTETGLYFEKGNGEVVPIEPKKMSAIFKLIAKNKKIECVVLNACNSYMHVEAIKPFVSNIIYTNDFVPDSITEGNNDTIASLFARKFYEYVFSGKDYLEAVERANTSLSLSDMPLPKNKKKEIDEIYAISTQ